MLLLRFGQVHVTALQQIVASAGTSLRAG